MANISIHTQLDGWIAYERMFQRVKKKRDAARVGMGAVLRTLRLSSGMTIRELSQLTGISGGCLSAVERGVKNCYATVRILAAYRDHL